MPEIKQAYMTENQQDCLTTSRLTFLLASRQESIYASCMTIIAVANTKGGVGKSTTAVHLAAWLYEQGYSVLLADCDTQHSSSEWIKEAMPGVQTCVLDKPNDILNELPHLSQDVDYVIADGPGSQTETSRALLLRADLAIVPCKASMLEVRALAKATEVLRQAQDIRGGLPKAVIVLSMVGKNYRLTSDMVEAAAALELPLASTPLILRQIYADSPGQGSVVWQMGARANEATKETRRLFAELIPEASKKNSRRKKEAA
ncbi:MAG: ParA family protein [Pirellulaceae bacterium]|nr:ParA family protein [Pirellulaceae bacterium]